MTESANIELTCANWRFFPSWTANFKTETGDSRHKNGDTGASFHVGIKGRPTPRVAHCRQHERTQARLSVPQSARAPECRRLGAGGTTATNRIKPPENREVYVLLRVVGDHQGIFRSCPHIFNVCPKIRQFRGYLEGYRGISTPIHFRRTQFGKRVLLKQVTPQFEAKMAFADVTRGIGFELRGMPLPCFNWAAVT